MTFLVKKLSTLLLFLLILQLGKAQKHEWVKGIGPERTDSLYYFIHPFSVKANSKGDVYSSGTFTGLIDFDPNSAKILDSSLFRGGLNGFISKLDSNGNYNWHQTLESSYLITYYSNIDNYDNFYLSGHHYYDSIYIDSVIIYSDSQLHSTSNHFITKFNQSNQLDWGLSFNFNNWYAHSNLIIDSDKNAYIYGLTHGSQDSIDFNPSHTETHNVLINSPTPFLLKLDSVGNFKWVKFYDIGLRKLVRGVSSQIFLLGGIGDTTIIQTRSGTDTLTKKRSYNAFLGKMNTNGNFTWTLPYHSNKAINFPSFEELKTDAKGNVYFFGTFSDSLLFGKELQHKFAANGQRDGFICKVDTSGQLIWFSKFDGNNIENLKAVTVSDSGNIFIGTQLQGKVNFPTINSSVSYFANPGKHINLIKFKTNGLLDWVKPIPASPRSRIEAIDWSPSNQSIYSTGVFYDKIIAGDTLSTQGHHQLFIVKTKDCEPLLGYDTLTLCAGDSSFIPNIKTSHSGTYRNLVSNSQSCDSLIQTYVQVYPTYYDTTYFRNCNGEPVVYRGEVFESDTSFTTYYQTDMGCDSNFIALIQIGNTHLDSQNVTLCSGDSLKVGSSVYDSTGIYIDSLKSIKGCDSIIYTELFVAHTQLIEQTIEICSQDSLQIGSNTYYEAGNYSDTLNNQFGCDSIINTELSFYDFSKRTQNITICPQDTFSVGNHNYNRAGTYYDTLTDIKGCDSIIITNLSLRNRSRTNQTFTLCRNYSITVDGIIYKQTGEYKRTLSDKNGCDSIVTTTIRRANLSISSQRENQLEVAEYSYGYQWINCDNETIMESETSKTMSYAQSGNYAVILESEFCSDTTDCFYADFAQEYNFSLYPNPTSSHCFIELPTSGEITIQNMRGERVFSADFSGAGTYKLDLPHLSSGIYMIQFSGLEGKEIRKLAITK